MPAFVLRRNWLMPLLGTLAVVAGWPFSGPIGWFSIWMGSIFAVATLVRNSFPSATPAEVRATDQDLEVKTGGTLVALVPLDEIAEMKFVPRMDADGMTLLTIWNRRGKKLWLRLLYGHAVTLSEQIGPRRVRFSIVPRWMTRLLFSFAMIGAPMLVMLLASADRVEHLPEALFLWLCGSLPNVLIVAWALGQVRGSATVGVDGIRIAWPLRKRFVPWNDVKSVEREGACSVVTTTQRQFRLQAREQPTTQADVGNETKALAMALESALILHRRRETGERTLQELVARGNQNGRQWLATIDRVARGGSTDYRMRAVDADMLKALAKDAASEIDERVGAAAALVRLDPTHRAVVRVAAEASADPGARARLLAVSEALDDAALESALERRI